MGETLRYQELSPVEVVVEEEEEEEGVAMEVDVVEAATEVEDMVEVCIALLGVFQGSQKGPATSNVTSCLQSFVGYNSLVKRKECGNKGVTIPQCEKDQCNTQGLKITG